MSTYYKLAYYKKIKVSLKVGSTMKMFSHETRVAIFR